MEVQESLSVLSLFKKLDYSNIEYSGMSYRRSHNKVPLVSLFESTQKYMPSIVSQEIMSSANKKVLIDVHNFLSSVREFSAEYFSMNRFLWTILLSEKYPYYMFNTELSKKMKETYESNFITIKNNHHYSYNGIADTIDIIAIDRSSNEIVVVLPYFNISDMVNNYSCFKHPYNDIMASEEVFHKIRSIHISNYFKEMDIPLSNVFYLRKDNYYPILKKENRLLILYKDIINEA